MESFFSLIHLLVLNATFVSKLVLLKVVEAIASIGARRRFIEALAPLFGRPLEVDPVFHYSTLFHNLIYFTKDAFMVYQFIRYSAEELLCFVALGLLHFWYVVNAFCAHIQQLTNLDL